MEIQLKRVLSLALAIVMVIGMMPVNIVMAEENPDVPGSEAQVEATTEPATEPEETTEPATEPEETTEPTTEPEETTEPATEPEETTEPATEPEETTEPATEPEETTEPATEPEETTEPATEPEETTEPATEPEETTEPVTEPEEKEPIEAEPIYTTVTMRIAPEVDLPDNGELFAYFAESKLYGYEISTFGTTARTALTANEQAIYDVLKARIESVALSGGSTEFVLPELGGLKYSWTNTELGLDSIEDDEHVSQAFSSQYNMTNIVAALLNDCPFDLYWYDKTVGAEMTFQIRTSGLDYGSYTVWNEATITDLTFTFAVSADYRSGVNLVTANVAKVTTAKNAAAQIVAEHADKSDYEKLVAYKNYICDVVSYDHAAAENESTPYGDPWQLISVFDGSDSTNVVCEGYSKAFQYLCDLGGLDCISVSGVMGGGTGEGDHMWNVVTLDGAKYLVDVTNTDTGSVGQDGELFLAGGTYENGCYSYDCGGQTVYFACADLGLAADGYTYELPVTTYTVTVAPCENGTVTANPTSAEAGTEIQLTVTPATNYALDTLTVTWGDNQTVEVTDNKFTMPAGDVTVSGTFQKTAIASGTCGENLTWTLDEAGTLTISGTGAMYDYSSTTAPWYGSRAKINSVVVANGVAGISSKAFSECSNLASAYIASSVTTISANSSSKAPFYGCPSSLVVYCGAASKPSGWDYSWDSVGTIDELTAKYGCAQNDYSFWSSVTPDIEKLVIPAGTTTIPSRACEDFENLKSVYIPDSVTKISASSSIYAPFNGCSKTLVIYCEAASDPDGWDTGWHYYSSSSILHVNYGLTLNDYNFWSNLSSDIVELVIPDTVTTIPRRACQNFSNLAVVYIPDSVTTIPANTSGNAPFNGCSKTLVIYCEAASEPDGWESYWNNYGSIYKLSANFGCAVGDYHFWSTVKSDITELVIPDTVTSIPNGACKGFEKLTSVHIPSGVTRIGDSAFSNCSNLSEITIPDTVAVIGESAFGNCSGLSSITLGTGLKEIQLAAFYKCSSLKALKIPSGVTAIGTNAFHGCTGLTTIFIPSSVTTMPSESNACAFYGCDENLTIFCERESAPAEWGAWSEYGDRNNTLTVNYGYSRAEYEYWAGLDKTGSYVKIADGITRIPGKAFNNCTNLEKVYIPDSVTSIGNNAFAGCTSLRNLYIPESVSIISAEKYNLSPFHDCSDNLLVYFGAAQEQESWDSYWNCNGSSVHHITPLFGFTRADYDYWMGVDKAVSSLVIPEGVTKIPDYFFRGREYIGDTPLSGSNTTLRSVTIPSSVKSVGQYAFEYCKALTTVTLANGVECIGEGAFLGCTKLTKISIPASVKLVDFYAFDECKNLVIRYAGTMLEWTSVSESPLKATCKDGTIVDYGSCGLGVSWLMDNNHVLTVFGEGSMTDYDYYWEVPWYDYTEQITKVKILAGVDSIGTRAFYGCSELTSVSIAETVINIEAYAFSKCTSLKSIKIPRSVNYIGVEAFYNNKALSTITFRHGKNDELIIDLGAFVTFSTTKETTVKVPNKSQIHPSIKTYDWAGDARKAIYQSHYCDGKHDVVSENAVEATCVQPGGTGKCYCKVCNQVLNENQIIPALGHEVISWEIDKEATYTTNGEKHGTCDRCGEYVEKDIPALGLPTPKVQVIKDPIGGGGTLLWEPIEETDYYNIYRATSSTGKYSKINSVSTTELTVSVPVGKTYYFKIKAICEENATLNSGYSSVVKVTGKCAQPEITVTAKASSGKPVVKWSKVSGAEEYDVYRATEETGTYSKVKTTTSSSYTDSSAAVGSTYYYKVKAIASKSTYNSAYSEVKSCLTVCARPEVTVKVSSTSGKPKLSWEAVSGAIGYEISRAEAAGGAYTVLEAAHTAVSYTDTSAQPDKAYWYKVRTLGTSEELHSAEGTEQKIQATLAKPVVTFKVDSVSGKPTLSWDAVEGAVEYKVYRSSSSTKDYKSVKTIPATEEVSYSYKDTSVSVAKGYYYKVIAIGNNSKSAYSSYKKLTAKCAQPNITATASASSGKPVVKWSKVSGAEEYDVYRATEETGTYSKVKTTTSSSYTDSSAAVGSTYYYKVKAIASKSTYNSAYSEVKACLTVCARPEVTVKVSSTSGKPKLSWEAVSGAIGYEISRAEAAGGAYTVLEAAHTAVSYTDTSAQPDKAYWYKVRTLGTSEELHSAEGTEQKIQATLAKPVVTFKVDSVSGKPTLSWDAVEGAVEYKVYRSSSSTKDYKSVKTIPATEEASYSYKDTSVSVAKGYYYKVIAIGNNSKSAYSSYKKLTAKCAQPEITVTAKASSGKPVVKWSKVSGAEEYDVYRATEENGTYSKVKTTTSSSYTDSSAAVGSTYYYKVKAIASKSTYNSAYSEVKACTAKCAQPVVSVKADSATGKPIVSWKAVSGARGYTIWRSENGDKYKLIMAVETVSYTDNETVMDSQYSYKVMAIGANSALNSVESAAKSITATCGNPAASIKLNGKKPKVSWEAVEGAVKYEVYRSTKSSSDYKKIKTVEGAEYTDSSAKAGITYYYKVKAVTAGGNTSAYSNTVKLKSK